MKIYWFIQDLKNVLINWEKCTNSNQCGEVGSRRINSRCKVPIFSKNGRKIAKINRNKRKFLRNLAKFTDISSVDISPPFFVLLTPPKHEISPKFWPKKPKFSSLDTWTKCKSNLLCNQYNHFDCQWKYIKSNKTRAISTYKKGIF